MEAGMVGFIQETLSGFLRCLGLEGGGGHAVSGGEEVANNPPPPSPPPLDPEADDTPVMDPHVDVPASPIDNSTITMDIDNNLGDQSNFTLVTIDEIINTSGGTTAEAHYVELLDGGQANMSLLSTSLISSGGGGETHSLEE
ncbi:hypothetical protein L1987_51192 [Smallanthus sonchifolius]|uniref:Uncharacterized protein n=1 Tax=Smallanthus sonchifolius TaxID=185202 RepID=A0ACB9EP08_9ASTR|nr:hypothetical protein L1987_51192 [Smallanthus sonchifolius]